MGESMFRILYYLFSTFGEEGAMNRRFEELRLILNRPWCLAQTHRSSFQLQFGLSLII
jgi:hypothetical protein